MNLKLKKRRKISRNNKTEKKNYKNEIIKKAHKS